jgi:hypothetical protein
MLGDQRRGVTAQGLLEMRAKRKRCFPLELFDEHAWDILLHLFISHVSNEIVSEAALIQMSDTSHGVGIRWLNHLVESGQIERRQDGGDVALTVDAVSAMREFLDLAHEIHCR